MDHVSLGRTGLKVSRLCLGTMNFGPCTSEPDSLRIMDRALDLGINFFDTADVYGRKRGEGVTEQILGRWFAQGGDRRQRVVLATKVFGDMDPPDRPDPNFARGLSARKIILACENSLRRMQTDWIDLYQMHHVDRACPWDEVWQAMERLVQEGKIRTSARRISPPGISPRPSTRPGSGTSWVWSRNRASTTSKHAPSNSRCFRPVGTSAWGSSPGAPWREASWRE